MQLNLRANYSGAYLTVETDNVKITEDISSYNFSKKEYSIKEDFIEQLITIANEMSKFNKVSDVDFVKNIYEAFLSDSEREQFLESITVKP